MFCLDLRCFDLESEQRDALSPRGVLEASLQSSEFDHDSSHDSYPESEVQCSQSLSHWKKFFKSWKKRSFRRLASFPPLGVLKISRRGNRSEQDNPGLSDLYKFKSSLGNFTFSELQTATNKFSQGRLLFVFHMIVTLNFGVDIADCCSFFVANLIGKGGYAEVYKGRLQNGQLIAVKKLNRGAPDERTACFLSELGIIAHIDHPNTAKLIGCCIDQGMHLVFKLSPNGSLGSFLHGDSLNLVELTVLWLSEFLLTILQVRTRANLIGVNDTRSLLVRPTVCCISMIIVRGVSFIEISRPITFYLQKISNLR